MNYEFYEQKNDKELIEITINQSESSDGRFAKEILEYRKYQAQKSQNLWMVILTIVIALTSIANIIMMVLN